MNKYDDIQGAWYVKDFADGWIKFYDVDMAIHEAKASGAIMRFSSVDLKKSESGKHDDALEKLELLRLRASSHAEISNCKKTMQDWIDGDVEFIKEALTKAKKFDEVGEIKAVTRHLVTVCEGLEIPMTGEQKAIWDKYVKESE